MTSLLDHLTQEFPAYDWQPQAPLAGLSYFKLGGPAEVYWETSDLDALAKVVAFCHQNSYKLTVLGGASNVVIADQGISGLVVHLSNGELEVLPQSLGEKKLIQVGAGMKTALLVGQTVRLGYQGLEYFLGVPGTVGGAVFNNSHYLSDLIGEHIHQVEIINQEGERLWITQPACNFGYDSSRFQASKEIIVQVQFALLPGEAVQSQAKIVEATRYRASTQPLGQPNSGCIFQNVPNTPKLQQLFPEFAQRSHVPGGFLIDQAGLKGEKVGGVSVSTKHAAFFVNDGRGTAHDVKKLVAKVKAQVLNTFGVKLQEEVFYLQ